MLALWKENKCLYTFRGCVSYSEVTFVKTVIVEELWKTCIGFQMSKSEIVLKYSVAQVHCVVVS